jgi:fatty acid desaturase
VTKATLHDELMREAGFETDYHRELERRRERRRRARAWAVAHALVGVVGLAALIELWGNFLPGLPRSVVATAIVTLAVAEVARWLGKLGAVDT